MTVVRMRVRKANVVPTRRIVLTSSCGTTKMSKAPASGANRVTLKIGNIAKPF
jgi:hypothetical protein